MKLKLIFTVCITACWSIISYSQTGHANVSSPYHAVFNHLHYLQPDSYEPALSAVSLNYAACADSAECIERAIQLKQILDGEGLFVNLEVLPKRGDYVDSSSNKATYVLFPELLPEVYLVRKDENWFFAPQTLQLIPTIHKKVFPFGSTFLMNLFSSFGQRTFLNLAIWQYLGFLLIALCSFILYWFTQRLLRPFVRRALKRWILKDDGEQLKLVDRLTSAISLLLILQIILYLVPMLLLPIKLGAFLTKAITIIQIACIALVLIRVANFFIYHLNALVTTTSSKMDDQLLPLLKKIVHLVIVAGAILQVLHVLEVNVTALIAGVSIGGLAIALAAQDAVKNFIGSIMIFADKPFQIGDYIIGSGFEGQVEEVGFRTTRIKSIDTSIISVPNGTLANMNIQNLGVRSLRIFDTKIGVTYDAQPEQLRAYVNDLKNLILNHEMLANQNYYVHVKEMAESSINIMFRAYLEVPGYSDELKIKEEIIYEMMQLAKSNGLEFAFPSQTIYTKSLDSPSN